MPQNTNKSESTASMEWLDDLEGQISTANTTEITRCIYTVPNTLTKNNDKGAYYHPQVVSIGPIHCRESQVMAMEKHKLKFLSLLLQRTKLSIDDLLASIRDLETEARECYSYPKEKNIESIINDGDRFLKLMVLDGCFLIELFLMAKKDFNYHLATIPRGVPHVYRDLLMVGNQIPFSVLEKLYKTSKEAEESKEAESSKKPEESKEPEESNASLSRLALTFFNREMERPKEVIEKFLNQLPPDQKPLHLLDLVRSSFLMPNLEKNVGNTQTCRLIHSALSFLMPNLEKNEGNTQPCRRIHSVTKLRRAGIKVKLPREADSFLDVKFRNGVIKMPNLVIDHFMETFLLNCVEFEQLHNSRSKQFTVYATFLDCLVDTTWDVNHLCEKNIFHSYFGKYDDVVQFINNMGKDLAFDDDQFYLSQLFEDVNERYRTPCKVQWASFKSTYFNTPWSFISAVAAFVILVLTFLQTYYTIYAYVHPNESLNSISPLHSIWEWF